MILLLTLIHLILPLKVVKGHMIMKTPRPYNFKTIDNSPLEPSGSNFPCHIGPGERYEEEEEGLKENIFKVGQEQALSFLGSAVHGGGSCQISLTTDKFPDKKSKWKVIHSILGNCPSNVTGNLELGNDHGAAVFQFKIPESVPSGRYTLAWTWFNKVGNREMYMNCAPITVIDGGDGEEEFPAMFIANIATEGKSAKCTTIEPTNVRFPDPGKYVDERTKTKEPRGKCLKEPRERISVLSNNSIASDQSFTESSSLTFLTTSTLISTLRNHNCSQTLSISDSSLVPTSTNIVQLDTTASHSSSPSLPSLNLNSTSTTVRKSDETFFTTITTTVFNTPSSTSTPTLTLHTTSVTPTSIPQPILSNACISPLVNCLGKSFQLCLGDNWSDPISLFDSPDCKPGLSQNLISMDSKGSYDTVITEVISSSLPSMTLIGKGNEFEPTAIKRDQSEKVDRRRMRRRRMERYVGRRRSN